MSKPVIVQAPFSFIGSKRRLWRLFPFLLRPLAWVALPFVWLFVACWYVLFGLLVVPWRLLRRSQRQEKATARRHAELLDR